MLAYSSSVDEVNHLFDEGKYSEALAKLDSFLADREFQESIGLLGPEGKALLNLKHGQVLFELGQIKRAKKMLSRACVLGGLGIFNTVDQMYLEAIWGTIRFQKKLRPWIGAAVLLLWIVVSYLAGSGKVDMGENVFYSMGVISVMIGFAVKIMAPLGCDCQLLDPERKASLSSRADGDPLSR